jgi:hypothetical protein
MCRDKENVLDIKKILCAIIIIAFGFSSAYGQDDSDLGVEKIRKPKMSDFYIDLSATGTGAGFKIHYQTNNPDLQLNLGVQIGGVRGENEYAYINYNSPGGYFQKGGRKFFTLISPVSFGIKKRLWRESIESDFRPFMVGEIGPVFGVAFPTGKRDPEDPYSPDIPFGESLDRGKGQVTAGGFLGFGVDLGNPGERIYGLTLGFHFYNFLETLGESKSYNGFELRINFLNTF